MCSVMLRLGNINWKKIDICDSRMFVNNLIILMTDMTSLLIHIIDMYVHIQIACLFMFVLFFCYNLTNDS